VSVGHPPFLLELDDGVPRPIESADSQTDYHRLLASPFAAQAAYLTNHERLIVHARGWMRLTAVVAITTFDQTFVDRLKSVASGVLKFGNCIKSNEAAWARPMRCQERKNPTGQW
jgi:hypothetical protein